MRTIILDTNFLMIPFTLGVPVVDNFRDAIDFPYKLAVIDKTIDELSDIQKHEKTARMRNAAKMAKSLVKAYDIQTIKTDEDEDVDDLILNYCKSNKTAVVATQDVDLRRRLRGQKTTLLVLRQKKYLEVQKY